MNFVKQKGGSTCKIAAANFDKAKEQFLLDIQAVSMEEILFDLVIRQDFMLYQDVNGQWKKGCKRVKIVGIDDKRQITVVIHGSLTGNILPFQLLYTRTTKA